MNDQNIAHAQRTLFDFVPEKLKKIRQTDRLAKPSPAAYNAWVLEPHVCHTCFGRIASMLSPDGVTRYRCTNCGHEGIGKQASCVCACGIKLHSSLEGKRVGPANRDAGIRCIANPKRSPTFPAEYVATHVGTKK
jgi:hypothetical protein